MERLVLASRRTVQDDHVIVRVRLGFRVDVKSSFTDHVVRLVSEISGRSSEIVSGRVTDPRDDVYTVKVVMCDEDGDDDTDSHRGMVDLAIPVAASSAEHGLPLLLAIAGYGSVFAYVKEYQIIDIDLPDSYLQAFHGPRYGADEIVRSNSNRRLLVGMVLKPRFYSSKETLARYISEFTEAGIDFIFDDELTVTSKDMTFDERVGLIASTVKSASDKIKRKVGMTTYIATATSRASKALALAVRAEELGADGIMVNPIVMGYDTIQDLVVSPNFRGLIVANFIGRAMQTGGPFFRISPSLLCKLTRLAGADAQYIQPFAGTIRNPRKAAAQYESALTERLTSTSSHKPSMAIMSGGISLTELSKNEEIYQAPLIMCIGDRFADAWESGISANVMMQCITSIWEVLRTGRKADLEEVLLGLQGKTSTHRDCLKMFGADQLV